MTSKQLNIVLVVVVVVLLGVVGYMALRNNVQTDILSQQNTTPNSNLANCSKVREDSLPLRFISPDSQIIRQNGKVYICPKNSSNTTQPLTNTNTQQSVNGTIPDKTDETANWKVYKNTELGFELKIPSYVSIDKVLNDQYNRLVVFKSDKEYFEVMLKQIKSTSLNQYNYLDFPVSSRSTLGGREALVFEAPNGYCDGPGCGDPFIAYVAKNNDDFYHLIFSGKTKLSDTEKTILSTFKFTSNTQTQNPTWKDAVYNQFKNLAVWEVNENLSDWRLVSLDQSLLNKYAKGKIFKLSKSFNGTGFSGSDSDDINKQIQQAGLDQTALVSSARKALTENGWKLVASPTEGSAYNDYLYVKDNHPLVLQIGSRDAVKGGMYVSIQFQY